MDEPKLVVCDMAGTTVKGEGRVAVSSLMKTEPAHVRRRVDGGYRHRP